MTWLLVVLFAGRARLPRRVAFPTGFGSIADARADTNWGMRLAMYIEDQNIAPTSRRVVLLGSTGSVGTQAADVIGRNADRFRVVGLAAGGGRLPLLAQQVLDLEPEVVAVARESAGQPLKLAIAAAAAQRGLTLGSWRMPRNLTGSDGVEGVASWRADVVVNGIDGALGLNDPLKPQRHSGTIGTGTMIR